MDKCLLSKSDCNYIEMSLICQGCDQECQFQSMFQKVKEKSGSENTVG